MTAIDRHALAPVIAAKVRAASFGPGGGTATRHAVIDDLLPADVALRIHAVFPVGDGANFIRRVSFRERKSTPAALDNFDPVLKEISFAIQMPRCWRRWRRSAVSPAWSPMPASTPAACR